MSFRKAAELLGFENDTDPEDDFDEPRLAPEADDAAFFAFPSFPTTASFFFAAFRAGIWNMMCETGMRNITFPEHR